MVTRFCVLIVSRMYIRIQYIEVSWSPTLATTAKSWRGFSGTLANPPAELQDALLHNIVVRFYQKPSCNPKTHLSGFPQHFSLFRNSNHIYEAVREGGGVVREKSGKKLGDQKGRTKRLKLFWREF